MIRKGRGRTKLSNHFVQEIINVIEAKNCILNLSWISTHEQLADAASRSDYRRMEKLKEQETNYKELVLSKEGVVKAKDIMGIAPTVDVFSSPHHNVWDTYYASLHIRMNEEKNLKMDGFQFLAANEIIPSFRHLWVFPPSDLTKQAILALRDKIIHGSIFLVVSNLFINYAIQVLDISNEKIRILTENKKTDVFRDTKKSRKTWYICSLNRVEENK